MANKQIITEYWNYYLSLESQFENSRRYISFDNANYSTYSNEYVQLLQAICSEIDVVGKVIAQHNNKKFIVKDANITKWGFEVQKCFKGLDLKTIYFDNAKEIVPFRKWKYKKGTKKSKPIVYFDDTYKTPQWWLDYNAVKHARTSIDKNEQIQNYKKANLKNVIYALGALYILNMILLQKYAGLDLDSQKTYSVKESSLFTWSIADIERKNQITSK